MSKKLFNLDPLRFFLAFLVLIFHIPTLCQNMDLPFYNGLPIFHRGTEAVLVFFTLSGFLIIKSLFVEKDLTGTISIKDFYIRRILRIYPVYYLVVILGFTIYHVVFPLLSVPYESTYNIGEGLLLCIFFLPNVFHINYEPGGILDILWSIGIEEQFYLFIAPIAFFLPKKRFLSFLGIFTIVFFLIFYYSPITYFKDYYSLFFYFSFGGLVAIANYLKLDKAILFNRAGQILLTLLFVVHFTTDLFQQLPEPAYHFVSMILFGIFVANISYNPNPLFQIKNKSLNYLGSISYGIYMYHMIVVYAVLFLFTKFDYWQVLPNAFQILFINLIVITGTIIAAHLSFKYLEMPFLKLKEHFRQSPKKKVGKTKMIEENKPNKVLEDSNV